MTNQSVDQCFMYRTNELNILTEILIKPKKYLYPLIHLYGLSGTGKTYFIKQFLNKLQNNDNVSTNNSIYLNSIELCHTQVDQLYSALAMELTTCFGLDENTLATINNASNLLRFLKKNLQNIYSDSSLLLVIDHANYLSLQNKADLNEFFLFLTKLNDYLVDDGVFKSVSIILISEYDWHSLLYDMDLVSNTELQRPYCIYFNDYTKEQMYAILCKGYESSSQDSNNRHSYTRIILEVFYSICKDLNELSYIVDTYYSHLCESMTTMFNSEDQNNTMAIWNKMKPFLKQALTKIYLRESFHVKKNSMDLTKQFESLNLTTGVPANFVENENNFVDLPVYAKYLLIAAYIATHNAAKYDKKLFDYGEGKINSRKIRYTSNYYQKTDELRHSAILKLQQFDLNRLLGIFYSLVFMHNSNLKSFSDLNLNSIFSMLQMLKNFNFIQQLNSSYSCLDEPKYKCLIDFETIQTISNSLQLNVKQYLCEYFL
jgi:origin recognition complex subunit 5